MRFLRRGGGEAEQPIDQRLETFWSWWAGAKDGIAADIERGTVAGRAQEISAAVDALHSKLAWELSPGATAKHALVVSPEGNAEFRHGDVVAAEDFYWADPAIFAVLPLPVFRGDLRSALAAPNSLTLSRAIARKYFGRDDVVGQTIIVHRQPMTITAVVEDIPALTELKRNGIFLSANSPNAPGFAAQGPKPGQSALTYVRLRPGVSVPAIRQRLHDAVAPVLAGPCGFRKCTRPL